MLILASIGLLLVIIAVLLVKIRKGIELIATSNMPREGFPQDIEASWEDIGARGRFLTDLGGMSVAFKEQMFEEFYKSLEKPISGSTAAGSVHDILVDLDEWLTKQKLEEQRVIESDK